jgi:hypothetical protein
MKDLWTGVYPTMATGGRCIAISTPNGVGNWFHQTYVDAESGTNDFHPIKLHWSVHPNRDQAWFEKETRNMSKREIAQEYECSFNASGETVISAEDLEYLHNNIKEPKYRTGIDRNYWIWKEFKSEKSYVLVADVARGDGKDNSVFHIIDIDSVDYWVIKELPDKISKIFIAEYNPYFGPDLEVTTPNIKKFNRTNYHFSNLCFGSSLKAIINILNEKGFSFIGVNDLKNNAFFVLNEYLKLISLDPPKENLLEYTSAKYREGRDIKGKLTYHSPDDVINIIKNCEVFDLKDKQIKKISELI